ncbi:unnamed protein product, partial [Symbiodinium necroappetens]
KARPSLLGDCFNAGAESEQIAAVEERLKLAFPAPLRALFALADGQKEETPGLLMVPKNKALRFSPPTRKLGVAPLPSADSDGGEKKGCAGR